MRTLTVEDILKLHSFSTSAAPCFAVSPDGEKLAFSMIGPPTTAVRFCVAFLFGMERSRVGIIDLSTGELDWIVSPDGTGISHPHWSPKGDQIAVIGSDGSFLRPFTIDLASKTCTERAQQDLALTRDKDPFFWISEIELVCDLLPSGERSTRIDTEFRGAEIARDVWPEAWAGKKSTGSSLRTSDAPRAVDEMAALSVINLIRGDIHSYPEEEAAPQALRMVAKHRQRKIPNEMKTTDERIPAGSTAHTLRKDKGFAIHVARDNDGTRIFKSDRQSVTLLHETDGHLKDVVVGSDITLPTDAACDKDRLLRCILPPG